MRITRTCAMRVRRCPAGAGQDACAVSVPHKRCGTGRGVAILGPPTRRSLQGHPAGSAADVEAVRGAAKKPAFQLAGDVHRRADDLPVPACTGDPQRKLAHRQILLLRQRAEQRGAALAADHLRQHRHGAVKRIGREIEARHARQQRHRDVRRDQRLHGLVALVRFLRAASDHRKHAGHDADRIRVAPGACRPRLEIGIEDLCLSHILVRGEHDFGRFRRKVLAVVGGSGLHEHRCPLRGARHVQWPPHRKMRSVVLQDAQPLGREEHPAFLVTQEGVIVPAIPQAQHDISEFARPAIAIGMRRMGVTAEIEGFVGDWPTSPGSSPRGRH